MFNFFKKKKSTGNKKAVILGLDGVSHSLLVEYMKRGIMPELSSLCTKGHLLKMRSSLPEISSVAWSSFITGVNPGQHGIFGFMEIDKETYEYTFPNFNSLITRPLWERENIKTVAFNIPQTYPARHMNGVMVSGFVALDLKKAVYPDRVFDYLNSIDYRIDVNARLASENPEAFFNELFFAFDKRKKAIEYLYANEDWDLFIGTVTETDRLHHFFYDSAFDGKYYDIFKKLYAEIDKLIGKMAENAHNDGAVFLTCSDHGFTDISTEVYLNRWLIENGYLKLTGNNGLKGITNESKAFCLDPSRIYIHSKNKYKHGSVAAEESKELKEELKKRFSEITFEGQRIIKDVYLKDDIFHGAQTSEAPDIYLLPNYGFDLKGSLNKDAVFGTTNFKGMHTYDDAHLFSSVPVDNNDVAIEDLGRIILEQLR